MDKIHRYTNIKRVVGISSMDSVQYYNNEYYRKQRENISDGKRDETFRKEKQKKKLNKQKVSQKNKVYKSTDPNVIYFMEYCKVRNKRIYEKLNSTTPGEIIDYKSRYDRYSEKTNNSINTKKMINAYNVQNQGAIDFETRKQEIIKKQNANNKKTNEKVNEKTTTKQSATKQNTAKQNANKQNATKQKIKKQAKSSSNYRKSGEKTQRKVISKEQEMKQFKASIKAFPKPKSDLDKAADAFERALREKNAYNEELRKKGYRSARENKNTARGRNGYTVRRNRNIARVSRYTARNGNTTRGSRYTARNGNITRGSRYTARNGNITRGRNKNTGIDR